MTAGLPLTQINTGRLEILDMQLLMYAATLLLGLGAAVGVHYLTADTLPGWLQGALVGVAALIAGGIGGSIGTVLAGLIGAAKAREMETHLMSGGLLLWVRTRDESHEQRALAILAGHNGEGVHLHTLPSLVGSGTSKPVEDVIDLDAAKVE